MSELFHHLSHRTAIYTAATRLSYKDLRAAVESRKSQFSHASYLYLNPIQPKIDFIINFIALFELELAQCPVSSSQYRTIASYLAPFTPTCRVDQLETIPQLPSEPTAHQRHPECVLVMMTSGSSGSPKAVQLSANNILHNLESVIESLHFEQVEKQVLFLPFNYAYGLLGQLLPGLYLGKENYLFDSLLEARASLPELSGKIMISGVPSHLKVLAQFIPKQQAAKVSHVVSAGDHLAQDLRESLKKKFNKAVLFNNYGLTEISPRALSLNSIDPEFFTSATGRPVRHVDVRLSDTGEVLLGGPQVMLGYLGENSASTYTEGWLHTGDLGQLDDGLVTILGRADDVVKIGGAKVSLKAITNVIKTHPKITEAFCWTQGDELYGKKVHMAIETGFPLETGELSPILKENELDHLDMTYHIMREFPRLTNGKLDRVSLKQQAHAL